jgi:hypothetical protein
MRHTPVPAARETPDILRREQSVRSRQHLGVLTRVLYESESLEILRTEMDAGTASDCADFRDFSAVHHVIEGTPVFRMPRRAADLMPGDSILLPEMSAYTISNCAPTRSVILSVLFTASRAANRAVRSPGI